MSEQVQNLNRTTAIVLAAGKGTRMKSARTKVLHEILDIPLVVYPVQAALDAGVEQVVVVVGHQADAVKTAVRQGIDDDRVCFALQEKPNGTGHAVLCARSVIGDDEPFAVLLPDDIVDAPVPATRQLIDVHAEVGTGVFALVEVPPGHEPRYGMVQGSEVRPGLVRCSWMIEKPEPVDAPSNLGIVGRYVLPGRAFHHLANTTMGQGGEIQLTDALVALMREEGMHGHLLQGDRYDTGEVCGLIEANLAYAMKDPEMAVRLKGFFQRYT